MATNLEFNRGTVFHAARGLDTKTLQRVEGNADAKSAAIKSKVQSTFGKPEATELLTDLKGKIQNRKGYLKLMHTEHESRTMAFETKSGLGALFTKNKRQAETVAALKGLFSKLNLEPEQMDALNTELSSIGDNPLSARAAAQIIQKALNFSEANELAAVPQKLSFSPVRNGNIQANKPKDEVETRLGQNLDAFRTISVGDIEIGGSARPAGATSLKNGTSVSDVLTDIKSAGFTHILSLDQSERSEYTEMKEGLESAGLTHLAPDELDIADAGFATGDETKLYEKSKPLDVNALKAFKSQVDTIKEQKGKMLVHCGAGAGRTGTMLASLLLAELVKNNPEYKRSARRNQPLDLYGEVTTQTTPLVAKAIETLRQADKNFTGQEKSVETEPEVRLLEAYEKELFANP